jgi:putative FmdB family regulatory protein
MPLYEYKCENCDEVFFELRKADEREAPITCPTCGGSGRVMISQFAQGGEADRVGSCVPGGT